VIGRRVADVARDMMTSHWLNVSACVSLDWHLAIAVCVLVADTIRYDRRD